jgi:ABC-type bacteriocin/lantibiotic exporter with double-glycine peptidase domain
MNFWEIIKRNIFTIIIVITLIVAMPWLGYLLVIPLVFIVIVGAMLAWRVHKLRNQIYNEAQQQQNQQAWWQRTRTRNEGEVTVVQTEQTEQRVSDDVGEYVDFKEVKEDKTKQ